jgi:hypothetical protein
MYIALPFASIAYRGCIQNIHSMLGSILATIAIGSFYNQFSEISIQKHKTTIMLIRRHGRYINYRLFTEDDP